eukprot:7588806-Alexandrium_andersonii.AAC.1
MASQPCALERVGVDRRPWGGSWRRAELSSASPKTRRRWASRSCCRGRGPDSSRSGGRDGRRRDHGR